MVNLIPLDDIRNNPHLEFLAVLYERSLVWIAYCIIVIYILIRRSCSSHCKFLCEFRMEECDELECFIWMLTF